MRRYTQIDSKFNKTFRKWNWCEQIKKVSIEQVFHQVESSHGMSHAVYEFVSLISENSLISIWFWSLTKSLSADVFFAFQNSRKKSKNMCVNSFMNWIHILIKKERAKQLGMLKWVADEWFDEMTSPPNGLFAKRREWAIFHWCVELLIIWNDYPG